MTKQNSGKKLHDLIAEQIEIKLNICLLTYLFVVIKRNQNPLKVKIDGTKSRQVYSIDFQEV